MRTRILRYRWPIVIVLALAALFTIVGTIAARPPVPHAVMPGMDCLSCHQSGAASAPRVSWDHLGRNNTDCTYCHKVSGSPARKIPHSVSARRDCLSCHRDGIGSTPKLAGGHVNYTNDECRQCHFASPVAAEPTPTPVEPTPTPETSAVPAGENACVACHQLVFADEEHTLFTGQPVSNVQAGVALFAQVCATCHGKDGTTPVGDEDAVINVVTYWGIHDDAEILQDIGIGSHGQMTAFAQDYGGPLSWEEILDVTAFIRSWGPVVLPSGMHIEKSPTFASDIGPLLAGRCGVCHGGAAGLTVTDYDALMTGSSSGPVVVPDDPDGSQIVEVQRGDHYAQLSAAELDLLIEWIAKGASK